MLGYRTAQIARPFMRMMGRAVFVSWTAGIICLGILALSYRGPLTELGGSTQGFIPAALTGLATALLIFLAGLAAIRKELRP